jgi:hypothetical protein
MAAINIAHATLIQIMAFPFVFVTSENGTRICECRGFVTGRKNGRGVFHRSGFYFNATPTKGRGTDIQLRGLTIG